MSLMSNMEVNFNISVAYGKWFEMKINLQEV
mgnify:CR=1 FL=1